MKKRRKRSPFFSRRGELGLQLPFFAMVERLLVRAFVALALGLALLAFVVAPVPLGEDGHPDLPTAAFGQMGLYRLEISLLVFYGFLLLITPAFSGLIRGRLPTEITMRGARFAEGTDQSAGRNEADIRRLEAAISDLDEGLTTVNVEIKRLKTGRNRR